MKLYAAGWILLITFTDMGLVKHGGIFESKEECLLEWKDTVACMAQQAKGPNAKYMAWGQPIGFCLEVERLNAPGVIFPMPKQEADCQ